jgi:hypothetical protein
MELPQWPLEAAFWTVFFERKRASGLEQRYREGCTSNERPPWSWSKKGAVHRYPEIDSKFLLSLELYCFIDVNLIVKTGSVAGAGERNLVNEYIPVLTCILITAPT